MCGVKWAKQNNREKKLIQQIGSSNKCCCYIARDYDHRRRQRKKKSITQLNSLCSTVCVYFLFQLRWNLIRFLRQSRRRRRRRQQWHINHIFTCSFYLSTTHHYEHYYPQKHTHTEILFNLLFTLFYVFFLMTMHVREMAWAYLFSSSCKFNKCTQTLARKHMNFAH